MKKVLIVMCALGLLSCNEDSSSKVESNVQEAIEKPVEKIVEHKSVYNEKGGFSTEEATKIPFTNKSADELSDLIGMQVRPNKGIAYNGYYSQWKKDGTVMMHGPFMAKSESPEIEDGIPGRAVFYKGTFYEDAPHDYWSEKVKIVSGDIQEDYNMTMSYDGGLCDNLKFKGSLHQEMKPTTFEPKGENVCDFMVARKKINTTFLVERKKAILNK